MPTDLQSADLHLEEDDPSPHQNPNPTCLSAKLCTPTTLRTQTSSALTPTTSSTSSKRVSVTKNLVTSVHFIYLFFKNLDANTVIPLSRCVRMVDRTTQREAGTFPQQLRHQDLGAAPFQCEEREACCVPYVPPSEDGTEPTGETDTVRLFFYYCLTPYECNRQLRQQTKRPSESKRGCFPKTRRLSGGPGGPFLSTAPLSTEQTIYCIYRFLYSLFTFFIKSRWGLRHWKEIC